jgi:hypothetical protein
LDKLIYAETELYSEHTYACLHEIEGVRMHGGFDAQGTYIPPRSLGRSDAIEAWTRALKSRGGDLFDANASLLSGARMPNHRQSVFLIGQGVDKPFWNSLTITGKIEGRGRVLAEMAFPDLQEIIEEDISEMALGHLNNGLLAIHGIDEGGEPEKAIGGHDVMWFVARDIVFGEQAHPDVEPPEAIARPEAGRRWMPEIEPQYEGMLSFLMNLLMIEFRAEIGFEATQQTFRDQDVFRDRREVAESAAQLIGRIRLDEEIHVESLRLYLGEFRELTVKTVDGGRLPGSELIDRFWQGLVVWATQEQPSIAAENQYKSLKSIILEHDQGEEILRQFDLLAD